MLTPKYQTYFGKSLKDEIRQKKPLLRADSVRLFVLLTSRTKNASFDYEQYSR
jgi:hypothetical protein